MSKISAQSAFRYPLSAVLSGQGSVRITREIFLHGGPLSVREVAARTGVTRKSVYLVIETLSALGLIERVGTAYSGLYRVAREHPLSPFLASLFSAEDARPRAVFAAIRQAAEGVSPGPVAVWLFGSVARGEDGARSDLDLAVCADEPAVEEVTDAVREALRPVGRHLAVRFSVVGMSPRDVARLAAEQDPFWTGLVRDARPMFGPEPEDVLRGQLPRQSSSAATASDV